MRKIISGGQTGADIAGLEVAKKFGFETGGTMPFGYKTREGPKPEYRELYGVEMHHSSSYVPRTRKNVKDSDGTLRLAFDFESAGEICTQKAIDYHKKPSFDVDLSDPVDVSDVIHWMEENQIEILNIAGNAESTRQGTHEAVTIFLTELFEQLKN